ncbi:MAG TPA: response regulator [Candidatus Limnocylindrales bacterium]|nr:response regulator [Candidatus Limnocylindrales bacterium]
MNPGATKGTILIVDDDLVFASELQQALEGAGYTVLVRHSGPDALTLVEQLKGAIDLAVIDVLLPGMSGFEVVGSIKRRPNAIKIVLTSLVMPDLYMEVAMTFGAHAVLRKTVEFQPAEWLKSIGDLMADAATRRQGAI